MEINVAFSTPESEQHHYDCGCGRAPTTGYHSGPCNPPQSDPQERVIVITEDMLTSDPVIINLNQMSRWNTFTN